MTLEELSHLLFKVIFPFSTPSFKIPCATIISPMIQTSCILPVRIEKSFPESFVIFPSPSPSVIQSAIALSWQNDNGPGPFWMKRRIQGWLCRLLSSQSCVLGLCSDDPNLLIAPCVCLCVCVCPVVGFSDWRAIRCSGFLRSAEEVEHTDRVAQALGCLQCVYRCLPSLNDVCCIIRLRWNPSCYIALSQNIEMCWNVLSFSDLNSYQTILLFHISFQKDYQALHPIDDAIDTNTVLDF